jgi:ketosteroid isomerase-like protein
MPRGQEEDEEGQKEQQRNKELVKQGFDRWAKGQGSFYDLLAAGAEWTITGTTPVSKTYTSRRQFLDEVIQPLSARLSEQIVPSVRALCADGDTVVALWDGTSVATDGKPYNNTYSWHLTMKDGLIVKAVAFFDGILLADLWRRVSIESFQKGEG